MNSLFLFVGSAKKKAFKEEEPKAINTQGKIPTKTISKKVIAISPSHLRPRSPRNPIMLLGNRHQMIHSPRIHQRRTRHLHVRDPRQPHTRLELILQDPSQMLDPILPIAQTVQKGSPDADGRGAEGERLEHVRTPRDAAVDQDFAPVEDGRVAPVEFEEGEERRNGGVEGATAVVGQDDGAGAVRDGGAGVGRGLHALDDDGEAGRLLDPGDVGPGEGGVDVLAHEAAHAAALAVVGGDGAADGGGERGVGGDAFVRFALAGDVGVDGDEDCFDAERAGLVEELGRFGSVGVDVELEEEGLVGPAGFDDGCERVGCVVGDLSYTRALF